MNDILLTGKEISSLYLFWQKEKNKLGPFVDIHCNIVVRQSDYNGIGSQVYVQPQLDYWEHKDNWVDITDYEAW